MIIELIISGFNEVADVLVSFGDDCGSEGGGQ